MPASPAIIESATPNGAFTPRVFAAHLATWKDAPAWWLERKRVAWEKFASLPLPKRTNETWRFSTVGTLNLDGFAPPPPAARVDPNAPVLGQAAALAFANNRSVPAAPAGALPSGVI